MAFLYVLWILLNAALVLGLLFGWYRCLQLFTRYYSRSAGIALCVVTLMTCSSGRKQASVQSYAHRSTTFASAFAIDRPVVLRKRLLDLPLTQITQLIFLNPTSKLEDSVRVEQSVLLSGLQFGLYWQPINLSVSPRPDRRILYDVGGVLEWRLLNATIYRQPVQYAGLLAVDTLPSRL